VIIYDILCTTKDEGIDVGNDAAACFDRMIKNCQNMSCRQHGADVQYLRLHAQTHQQLKYYVKDAFGVSIQYNEYTPQHPWYGAGQGAGDATIRWVVLSHSLLTAYKTQAKLWKLSDPTQSIHVTQGIDAFCNDTSLIDVVTQEQPQTTTNLMQTTQMNLNLWNNLLEASRGVLNPTKCTWVHFQWQPCHDLLTLQTQTQANTNPQLFLSRLGNMPQPLQKLQPYMPYRYLGIHLSMSGNRKKELQVLNNHNTKYLQVLTTCSLNRREAKVIY